VANIEPVVTIRVRSEAAGIPQHRIVGLYESPLAIDVGCHDTPDPVRQPEENLLVTGADRKRDSLFIQLLDILEEEREQGVLPEFPSQLCSLIMAWNDAADTLAHLRVAKVRKITQLDVLTTQFGGSRPPLGGTGRVYAVSAYQQHEKYAARCTAISDLHSREMSRLGPLSRSLGRLRATSHRAWESAMVQNMENVVELARSTPPPDSVLDLGCDAGGRTTWIAERVGARTMHGLEIASDRAEIAASRGVHVTLADLSRPFPYENESFDLVVSNQVIEHVVDTDNFVREAYRVLKPGGRAVISTENLASWHNVASLVLGWQPFSLTNISEAAMAVGNPLGVHRGEVGEARGHLRVFAYRGLRELISLHGFAVMDVLGAGYYPFSNKFARLDPRHAAFITVGARRPATEGVSGQ
jgi:SAM-dependent methyltransferase